MGKVIKRPIVIRDLMELATYIANGNIDISDNFILAAEKTFVNLGNFPMLGKSCSFSHRDLTDIRQKAIKSRYSIRENRHKYQSYPSNSKTKMIVFS